MSLVSLRIAASALSTIQSGLEAGGAINVPALEAFNAGLDNLASTGVEPSDNQQQAFANLTEMLIDFPEAAPAEPEIVGAPAPSTEGASSEQPSSPSEAPTTDAGAVSDEAEGVASPAADAAAPASDMDLTHLGAPAADAAAPASDTAETVEAPAAPVT